MTCRQSFGIFATLGLVAALSTACGGKGPPPQTDDVDPVAAALGDTVLEQVAVDDQAAGTAAAPSYTGPCKLTVNLAVVNDKNPKGSYRLLGSDGTALVENGVFGQEIEINQGQYTVEYKSPLVFGGPLYLTDVVPVAGEKQTIDNIFPAGQITLHTFRGKAEGKCVPVPFTVYDLENAKDVPGKGKTCAPLILETGHYEVRLEVGKNQIQPVEMRINREQVQTSKVQLEK
jgi:hypothetical protein